MLQRLSRLEEEEKNRIETKKRKFFAEVLNAARELQVQVQAAQKCRKQRNDGVQACCFSFRLCYFHCSYSMRLKMRIAWGMESCSTIYYYIAIVIIILFLRILCGSYAAENLRTGFEFQRGYLMRIFAIGGDTLSQSPTLSVCLSVSIFTEK